MVLLKLSVVFIHKKEFIELLVYTHKNFWHTNYSYNELLLLQNCRKISIVCISLINVCAQGTVFGYVLTPIVGTCIDSSGSIDVFPVYEKCQTLRQNLFVS